MPSRQFTCLQCNRSFESSTGRAKYCGRECYDRARTLPRRQCLQCGQSFAPSDSTMECCSKKCAGIHRRTRLTIECRICGASVQVNAARSTTAAYCSRKCKGESHQRSCVIRCAACGKEKRVPQSLSGKQFCSVECKYTIRTEGDGQNKFGRKNGRAKFACAECGKECTVHKYVAQRRRFCSPECTLVCQARENAATMVELSCLWCKQIFRYPESQVRAGRKKFCSRECNGAYTARYKQNRVSGTETQFFDQLELTGLRLRRQVRVRRYVVDAVCADRNVAIEFDGEYWHSFPHVIAKDERKSDAIAWAGYKLIRVPERDWMDDPTGTITRVLEEVSQL